MPARVFNSSAMVKSILSRSERQSHPDTTRARRVVADQEFGGCDVETVSASAVEETLSGSLGRRRIAASLAVVCAYLVLGLAAFWPDLPHMSGAIFSRATLGDPQLTLWQVAWVHYALEHGLNPFFSHAIFVPGGLNLGINTASPLLGLVTTPLAPFVRPVTILNLIAVIAMPISATAAFFVLRKWKVWLPAAAIGGLVYGFGPNMVGQNLDLHIELTFLPEASAIDRRYSGIHSSAQGDLLAPWPPNSASCSPARFRSAGRGGRTCCHHWRRGHRVRGDSAPSARSGTSDASRLIGSHRWFRYAGAARLSGYGCSLPDPSTSPRHLTFRTIHTTKMTCSTSLFRAQPNASHSV